MKTQAVEGKYYDLKESPLIDDCFDKFLAWASENKASWKDDEQRWASHIDPSLSGQRMNQIKTNQIQSILDSMQSYAPATQRHVLQLINRVYNWSRKQGLYSGENPCQSIELPRFDNTITRTLNKEELNRLKSVLKAWPNERARLIVLFALYSGKRKGEIDLKWSDVDLQNELIRIFKTRNKTVQTIPVNHTCLEKS